MPNTIRAKMVNPRLGSYFSIFGSLIIALFVVLLILEHLQTPDYLVRLAVLLGPAILYVVIGALSITGNAREFFAAGRRVPAVCSGLVLALTAFGGTGIVAWTGAAFINGFDVWCISIGLTTGFVIMGVAIAPYLRKSGAYTVPTFLARRFHSRLLRVTAASVLIVPMLLILMAEFRIGLSAARALVPLEPTVLGLTMGAIVVLTVAAGGIRGLSWSGTGQAIMALIAIVTLAGLIGILETNFPISQLSYGPVLRGIGRFEVAQNIPIVNAAPLAFNLAGTGFEDVVHRFARPYSSVGPFSFALATLTVAAGVAAGPWLLPRSGTTIGVYEARKSLGWAVFFIGLITLTLSALAVFMRDFVMQDLVGRTMNDLPGWFKTLSGLGWAKAEVHDGALQMMDFAFKRDAILFALPVAAGFPPIVQYLMFACAIAAALAAASATTYAIATLLAEDVIGGLRWDPPGDQIRVGIARVMSVVVVVLMLAFQALIHADPLQLFLWAAGLAGATAFPVVILSIWWKRLTPLGAFSSLLTGFGVALTAIFASQIGLVPVPASLVAIFGLFPAVIVAIVVSRLSPVPAREVLEQVRDMRVPGGETIYDREMRLHRLQQNKRRA